MEVTKLNFYEQLPYIKEAIDQSTFLSIDCELTGLNVCNDINGFDTQKQYYEKVRRNSRDFLVIQYGICAFRYDSESNVFKQQAYNFYVFPQVGVKYVPDQRFLCQTSSIDFLVTQGFDFNKLFKEGIPYLNSVQEMNYRVRLSDAQKVRASNIASPQKNMSRIIPSQDQAFVDDIKKQIRNFLDSNDEELTLPKCNSYLRVLTYQTVHRYFDNKVSVKTKVTNGRDKVVTVVKYTNAEQRLEEENKRIEEELLLLENTVGFSKVIKHLAGSGKVIVGHNMCLDLLHTIDKFVTPLPGDYDEFKDCMHCVFSNILDTKYMSTAQVFKEFISSNVLGHLLERLSKEPFNTPSVENENHRIFANCIEFLSLKNKKDIEDEGSGYKLKDQKEHEAGYDAFITGLCFLAMWKYIGDKEGKSDKEIFSDFNLVKPYMNKLFLMRLQDAPYIHLGGKDPTPDRDHVFYLTFPEAWKTNDIVQLFSPFGPVYVSWINDHSAYVGLTKRHQAAIALSTLSQSETYSIMTYAKRQAQLAGLTTVPISPFPISRKRLSDGYSSSTKKRKTMSFEESTVSRKSIDPIPEVQEAEVDKTNTCVSESPQIDTRTFPVVKSSKKRALSKAFEEDSSWD